MQRIPSGGLWACGDASLSLSLTLSHSLSLSLSLSLCERAAGIHSGCLLSPAAAAAGLRNALGGSCCSSRAQKGAGRLSCCSSRSQKGAGRQLLQQPGSERRRAGRMGQPLSATSAPSWRPGAWRPRRAQTSSKTAPRPAPAGERSPGREPPP